MSNDEQRDDDKTSDERSEVLHWAGEDHERPPDDDDERAERQAQADAERKIGSETEDPWVE